MRSCGGSGAEIKYPDNLRINKNSDEVRGTLTIERKRCPDAAASSAALGEYISEFVMDEVKLNAAAKNPTN